MHRLRKHRPSPAMIVATLALFVAIGGGAYAATKLPKNSVGAEQIKKGAVTPAKLSAATQSSFSKPGPKGEAGPRGAEGARGEAGPKGDPGAQGPGATTLVWDEAAGASPTMKPIGTVLGDTFSAECSIPGVGETKVTIYIKTSDGSLRWDVGTEESDNGVDKGRSASFNYPVGTFLAPTEVAGGQAGVGQSINHNSEVVQMEPTPGYLNVHSTALTSPTQTCHVSIMSFPSA